MPSVPDLVDLSRSFDMKFQQAYFANDGTVAGYTDHWGRIVDGSFTASGQEHSSGLFFQSIRLALDIYTRWTDKILPANYVWLPRLSIPWSRGSQALVIPSISDTQIRFNVESVTPYGRKQFLQVGLVTVVD